MKTDKIDVSETIHIDSRVKWGKNKRLKHWGNKENPSKPKY